MNKNYFFAIATLSGMIIGAGVFALPLIVVRSGWLLFIAYICVLGFIQFLIHLLFAKVIVSTGEKHRIPGYAKIYGGNNFRNLASFFAILGSYGALLAYIILGGIFFYEFLSPYLGGDLITYTVILFFLETAIVFFGFKALAEAETLMTLLLVFSLIAIIFKGFGKIDFDNYSLVNMSYWFLPYGPIFFAIGGDAAIPEVCRLLENDRKKIKSAIFFGTILPVALMAIFALVMAGITGGATTPDTLTGIKNFFGNGLITFSLFFGLLCIVSSYIVIAQATREIFWWDFKIDKNLSLLLAAAVPFIFYLFGLNNLTTVVGVSGAIAGSTNGIILISLALLVAKKPQIKPKISINIPKILIYIIILFFIIGLASEFLNLLK